MIQTNNTLIVEELTKAMEPVIRRIIREELKIITGRKANKNADAIGENPLEAYKKNRKVIFPSGDIQTGFVGFEKIINVAEQVMPENEDTYEVDMSSLTWMDANMCASLGAILYKKQSQGAKISLTVSEKMKPIMLKNHFLLQFGRNFVSDEHGTAIQYQQFDNVGDMSEQYQKYVSRYFRKKNRSITDNIHPNVLKSFRQSLFEIFKNAVEHSDTRHGVFVCGQFFPEKRRLNFSIADLGIGIRGNIYRKLGKKLSSTGAIHWATSGKTTRRDRPGGVGLEMIRDFVKRNRGALIIVSDAGYWEFSQGYPVSRELPIPFPGTVVNIEINTSNQNIDYVDTEIDLNNIF